MSEAELSRLTVKDLRERLAAAGLSTGGLKAELVARLGEAEKKRGEGAEKREAPDMEAGEGGEGEERRAEEDGKEAEEEKEEAVKKEDEEAAPSAPKRQRGGEDEDEEVVEPALVPVKQEPSPEMVPEVASENAGEQGEDEEEGDRVEQESAIVLEDQPEAAAPAAKRKKKAADSDYLLPPPEDGILPFLAIIPNVGKLQKHKKMVSTDQWAFGSWLPILDYLAKDKTVPMQYRRQFYTSVLKIFPLSGRIWRELVEAEIKSGKEELVMEYVTQSLRVCHDIDYWLVYLDYMSSRKLDSMVKAREDALQAFEYAIDEIGYDPEAGPIWMAYVSFLKKMTVANVYEENDRKGTIRRLYQRAITVPLSQIEDIWRDYQKWEQAENSKLALELTNKLASTYTNARVKFRERAGYTKGIRRNQLAVPPTESGDMPHQVLLWKRLLLYEKCNPLRDTDPLVYEKNLFGAFDRCVTVLRFYPEIWIDYANTMQRFKEKQAGGSKEAAAAEARLIWVRGLESLPNSTLLHFEYSHFLEANMQLVDAGSIYNMMLERDFFSLQEKQLTLIHQLLFVRRTKGMQEARRFSVRALQSEYASWELYVTAARVELFMNREPLPARKLFDHGMKLYGKHVPYLLQYITTLYAMNEEANMRVMFDSFMRDDELRFNRELWDEYLRFELCYGNRLTIDSVARRRAEALGNAVDPNGIFGTVNRFKVLDLFPSKPEEIRAMSLGVNVMLKDGTRGDTEDFSANRSANSNRLRQSQHHMILEGGNPLQVMFRDPPALAELPRPKITGEGCNLIQYTREMAVGATLPGQDGAVPAALLDLLNMLPQAHEFTGPAPSPDLIVAGLRNIQMPAPPVEEAPFAQMQQRMAPLTGLGGGLGSTPGAGAGDAVPSASDIFRMRQLLKEKRKA